MNDDFGRRGGSNGVFAPGVKTLRFTGKNTPMDFRILPAFDPNKVFETPKGIEVDPESWVPFRKDDDEGSLNTWGRLITEGRWLGHPGGRQVDIVSETTYGESESSCVLLKFINTVAARPEWRYLQEERPYPTAKGVITRKALPTRAAASVLINLVCVDHPGEGVQLGVLSNMTMISITGRSGIGTMANASVSEEALASDYCSRWACGDLTKPGRGIVVRVEKDTDTKKPIQGFVAVLAMDSRGGLRRFETTREHLMDRYNLYDIESLIPRRDAAFNVRLLVEAFDGVSPTGVPERELLRELFSDICDIPSHAIPGQKQTFAAPAKRDEEELAEAFAAPKPRKQAQLAPAPEPVDDTGVEYVPPQPAKPVAARPPEHNRSPAVPAQKQQVDKAQLAARLKAAQDLLEQDEAGE
jgi:hypothetical protein